ncbi:ATPase, histidine kinase-, DNA gyrase B-, and HSP90-like domain protein [Verrucomicrobiia bacterium DG1235]|nr:ATPase, histidine kinase-, DNA gyrase B-, and HSP90-like domain protein [Verrucomicrobiae bacterium DG1235]
MLFRLFALGGSLWAWAFASQAMAVQRGTPLLREVFVEEYQADGGYELAFGSSGVGYLASQGGLFRMEGSNWRELEFGRRETVYSVDLSEHGVLYVGLFGDFGYIDTREGEEYVSVFGEGDFGDTSSDYFDEVLAVEGGAYARAGGAEFFWDGFERTLVRLPEMELDRNVFEFRGRLYRIGGDLMLRRLDAGRWIEMGSVSLPEGAEAAVSAFSAENDTAVCLVISGRWLLWFDGRGLSSFADLGKWMDVRSVELTRSGNVVVGIVGEGVLVFDREANLVQSLNRENGLLDGSLIDLAEDADGRVWIMQERGLSMAQLGLATTRYDVSDGLEGEVNALAEFGGQLYAGTSLGLFRRDFSVGGLGDGFVRVGGVGGCKSLERVGDVLVVGTYYGLYEIRDDELFLVKPEIDSSYLKSISGETDRVLVGSKSGLTLFSRLSGVWAQHEDWDFEFPVYGITEEREGVVWINSGEGLIRRAELRGDSVRIEVFTTEDGLTDGWTSALEFGGRVAFTTKSPQLLGFDPDSRRFEKEGDLTYFPPPGPYVFREDLADGSGRRWAKSSLASGNLIKKPEGDYGEGVQLMGGGPRTKVNGFIALEDGSYVFAMNEGILHYDERFKGVKARVFKTWISSLKAATGKGDSLDLLAESEAGVVELEIGMTSIRVSAEVNQLQMSGPPLFVFELSGPKSMVSEPGKESTFEFSGLQSGDYTLTARAIDEAGELAAPAEVRFRVLPLFYQTKQAYAFYTLSALGLFLLIGRFRILALRRSNAKLARLVEESTSVLNEKNEKLVLVNRELKEMAEHAEQAAAAKSSFLAVMSHEIRTPLNGVIGMCSVLRQTNLDSMQRDYLESIRVSGLSLLEVVNDILDYSKIEKGRLSLECILFDLVDLVESVVSLLGLKANEKELDLHLLIDPRIKRLHYGDPTRVRQILYNLLGNAIKFTKLGSVTVSLYPKSGYDSDHLVMEVSDTGVGIEEDKHEAVFEAFAQSDVSDVRKFGGTGLGLSICRQLAGLMGGDIELESRLDEGSTFRVSLSLPAAEDSIRLWNSSALKGGRVVLSSGNGETRRYLGNYLSEWGLSIRYVDAKNLVSSWSSLESKWDCFVIETKGIEREDLNLLLNLASESDEPMILLDSDLSRLEKGEKGRAPGVELMSLPVVPSRLLALLSLAFGKPEKPLRIERGLTSELESNSYPSFDGMSVLLAEDNEMNQEVARRLLLSLGVEATVVSNGLEAVKAFEKKAFDLVLMDVQMPEMGGIEATKLILSNSSSEVRPFVYCLTAGVLEVEIERCKEAGMVGFIGKPFSVEDLVQALRAAQGNSKVG